MRPGTPPSLNTIGAPSANCSRDGGRNLVPKLVRKLTPARVDIADRLFSAAGIRELHALSPPARREGFEPASDTSSDRARYSASLFSEGAIRRRPSLPIRRPAAGLCWRAESIATDAPPPAHQADSFRLGPPVRVFEYVGATATTCGHCESREPYRAPPTFRLLQAGEPES